MLLVDDVVELRALVRRALLLHGGFDVVAEAPDGIAAVDAASTWRPDIVVVDLGLPDLAGRDLIAGIRAASPRSRIVVYTGTITGERLDLAGHVEGFVRKEQEVGYLVDLLSDLGRRRYDADAVDLGSDAGEVGRARRSLSEWCSAWGCTDSLEDAQLVLTELVTNALRHAGSRCRVRARYVSGVLRLEVTDMGGGNPNLRLPGELEEGGRGLLLVSALSTAWGVDALDDGRKVVWAELLSRGGDMDPDDGHSLSAPNGNGGNGGNGG